MLLQIRIWLFHRRYTRQLNTLLLLWTEWTFKQDGPWAGQIDCTNEVTNSSKDPLNTQKWVEWHPVPQSTQNKASFIQNGGIHSQLTMRFVRWSKRSIAYNEASSSLPQGCGSHPTCMNFPQWYRIQWQNHRYFSLLNQHSCAKDVM